MTFVGIGILLIVGAVALDFLIHFHQIRRLRDVPPKSEGLPSLSIVVPVRNEEQHVEAALTSVLSLDYPDFEVVVLDDRSTDATPALLARMAKQHPELQVKRIESLPEGWLGKNHALYQGALASRGEYLLFTDADILYEPDTLRRAIAYLENERADFLALFPGMLLATLGTKFFASSFIVLLHSNLRPWSVSNPKSKAGFGIGAFSLVKRIGYEKLGTHSAFPLFPDDDIELGRRAKKVGLACRVLDGNPLVKVPWYPTVWEGVKGFEKNFFAGLEFSVPYTLFACGMLFLLHLWPWIGLFIPGDHRMLYALTIGVDLGLFAYVSSFFGSAAWYAFGYPIGIALFIFTALRSMVLTLRQGGIRWRGTLYPLAALRAARRNKL